MAHNAYQYPARGRGYSASNHRPHPYARFPEGNGRGRGLDENVRPPTAPHPPERPSRPVFFDIDGAKFKLILNGSKLKRLTPPDPNLPTPPKHQIGGVWFYRTKGGNLLRHTEYLAQQEKYLNKKTLCPMFTRTGIPPLGQDQGSTRREAPLQFFLRFRSHHGREQLTHCTGSCRTRDCPLVHDPNKLSACKSFLHKRSCAAGTGCALSHDLTPQRTPICHYYSRGNCTNRNCQYVHAIPKEGAHVCDKFARIGFCEAGADCAHVHVFECPSFANTGKCDEKKCHLPHVQHAGQLRRLNNSATSSSAEPPSNEHSEDESEESSYATDAKVGFFEDLTGDKPEEKIDGDVLSASAFKAQEDFIRL